MAVFGYTSEGVQGYKTKEVMPYYTYAELKALPPAELRRLSADGNWKTYICSVLDAEQIRRRFKYLDELTEQVPNDLLLRNGIPVTTYYEYLKSPRWRRFRELILRLAGFKCQQCGIDRVRFNVHHLHYNTFMHETPDDVKLLCIPCHEAVHTRG